MEKLPEIYSAPSSVDPQLVYLDPLRLDRERIDAGLSRKDLAIELEIAFNTLREIFRGGGVQAGTAATIARRLGYRVTELLAPWDPRYQGPGSPGDVNAGPPEWEAAEYFAQSRLAPNGLCYVLCRMKHCHTPGKQGRGKFYQLAWLPDAAREEMLHKLARHPQVSARVGVHPHIVVNYTSTPVADGQGWWVVDNWVGKSTLADHISVGPWPVERLPRLLLEIALGLEALHQADVVFRELAPIRVIITEDDRRAVLTDFELAKLLDGAPSVSSDWPEDPYRAPEVAGGKVSIQADLYSFGRVALDAAAGAVTDPSRAGEVFEQIGVSKRLRGLLLDCLEPLPERRPADLSLVLKELSSSLSRSLAGCQPARLRK